MIDTFKEFMRNVGQNVFIVIGRDSKNNLAGLTISSFNSISIQPIIITFSIDKKTESSNVFKDALGWTISLLGDDQPTIAMTFSDDKISQGERFKQINFTKSSILKIPYIEHSIGYLEAIYYKSLEIADHLVFFTKVINVKLFNNKKKPLIYYKRNYTTII